MRAFLVSFVAWILIAAGSFLMVRGGLDYWESRSGQDQVAQQWQQQSESSAPAATSLSTRVVPHPKEPRSSQPLAARAGDAVARLSIPRLSTVLYVVEGTDDRDLKRGPGHLQGSVMPGQDGNCIIAGHRDTHFRILRNIKKGDEIVLDRAGREFRYRVNEMSIISPDNTACLRPSSNAELNLITCYPFQFVGSAPKRFVVHATLEGSAS